MWRLVCHIGPPERAARDLEPLLSFGSPVEVQVGPMPYAAVNAMLDPVFPHGAASYWKSTFLQDLSDGAIGTLVDCFARCPSPMTPIAIEHFHGEVTRVPADATAVAFRDPGFNVVIPSVWTDPPATDANVAWTRETYAALAPFASERRYVNYLDADDTGEAAGRAAWGPNYDWLVDVKTAYDPGNLFRLNVNVPPRS